MGDSSLARVQTEAQAPHDVFYATPEQITSGGIILEGEENRHLHASLRKRPGDIVAVVDGRGTCYTVELVRVERQRSEARILGQKRMWGEPGLHLTVATAVPKGSRIEFAIEKGTELGVSRFVPLRTRRSVAGASPAKVDRWRRLALAAMKQARRSVLPEVTEEVPLLQALERFRSTPWKFVADANGNPVGQTWNVGVAQPDAASAVVLIGPEGGLTHEEISTAVDAGFVPIALGPRRLRVETATVVAATLLMHAFGELI